MVDALQEDRQVLLNNIQAVINQSDVDAPNDEARLFYNLVLDLRKQSVEWPAVECWNDFLQELFALDQAKEWFRRNFSGGGTALEQKKNKFRAQFEENALGANITRELREAITQNTSFPLAKMIEKENENKKIERIREACRTAFYIPAETVLRVLKGQVDLKMVIENGLDRERKVVFLEKLQLEDIGTSDLSSKMMEWLLVSQGIFLPQQVDK